MANKRDFKKYVETVGASVCEAMMATYYNEPSVDKKEITKAIEQVLCAVATARCNSNVTFDKGRKAFESANDYNKARNAFSKQLFDKINDDFGKQLDEAIKTFNAAIPQNLRDEYKKVAAE